jgi:hypothetical protein
MIAVVESAPPQRQHQWQREAVEPSFGGPDRRRGQLHQGDRPDTAQVAGDVPAETGPPDRDRRHGHNHSQPAPPVHRPLFLDTLEQPASDESEHRQIGGYVVEQVAQVLPGPGPKAKAHCPDTGQARLGQNPVGREARRGNAARFLNFRHVPNVSILPPSDQRFCSAVGRNPPRLAQGGFPLRSVPV